MARAGLSAGAKASLDGGRDATALAERLHQALDVATGLQEENALLRRAVAQSRRRQSSSSDVSGQGGRRTSHCRVSVPRLSLAARPPAYDDDPDAEWALEPLRVNGAEMLLDRGAWRLYSRLRDAPPWVAAAGTVDAASGEAYLPDLTEQRPDFFAALETHLRSRPSLRLRDIFAAAAADEAAQHADEYSDAEEAAAVAAALGAHALAGLLRGAMPTAAPSDVAYFLTMVDPTGVRRLTYPQLAEAMQAATAAEAQHTAALGAARRHVADGVSRSGDRLADFFRRHCPAGAAGITPQQTAGLLLDVLGYARPEDADPSDAMDEEADARVLLARLRRAAPDADAAAAVSLADLHAELRLTPPAVRTPAYEAGSLPEEGSHGDVAPPRKASRVSTASAPLRASGGAGAAAAEASEARRDAEARCAEAEAAAAEAAAEAEAARDEVESAREEAERLREELRAARDGTLELRRTLERERTRAAAAATASPQPKAATPARTPSRRQASLDGSSGMATSDAAAAAQSAASAAAAAAAAAAAQHAQSGLELELRSAAARGAEASARADAAEAALSAFKANHAAVLRQLESTHARLADERVATAASAGEARRLGAELAAARELAPLLTAARLERAALEDENKALMAAALAAPATGAELRAARAALAEARRARAEAEGALADAHRELLAFAPPGGGGAGEPDYRSLRAERDALRSAAERSRVELEAANDTLAVMRAAAAAAAERGPPSPPPPPSPVGPSPAEWEEAEAERAALSEAADAAAEELRAAGKRIALLEAQLADARAELAEAQQRASAAGEAASEHAAEQAAELDAARADMAGLRAALAARGEALAAMTSELTAAQAAARAARTAAAAAAAAAAQMAAEEEEPPGAHMAAAVARAEASESARRAAAAALDEADALAEAEEAEAALADAERVASAARARQALERAAAAAEAARADAEAELAAAARAAEEEEAAAEARAYAEAEAAAEEAYAQMEADAEEEELDTAEALLARGPRVSHAAGGSRAAPRSSTASVLGPPSDEDEEDDEPPADDSLADDENVLALTLHGLSVERGALRGEVSPATFLTVDFFEHETQATPLVHGFAPELEQAYEFVVLVDNLLLQYMEMDCLRVELNVANGLDFRTLGAAAFPLRRLLREVEAGRGRGRGGRTRHTVPFRAVGGDTVGSLTLSCRMARPLDAALAAYRAAAPFAFLQRGSTPPAAPGGGSRASFEFPRMARASVPAEAAPPIAEEEPPAAEDAETAAAEAAAEAAADSASVTIRVSHVQLGPDASSDTRIRGALVLFDFLADVFPEADQRTPAVLKPAAGGRLSYSFERTFACGSRSNPAAFAALRAALAPRAADADEGGAADPVDELADGAVLQFLLVADPGSGGTFRDLGAAELPLHALLARGDVVDAALPISDAAGRPVATVTVSVIGAAAVAAAARDDL